MGADVGWKLKVNGLLQNTTAITESSLESFVLGTHQWTIEEDNTQCSKKGEPYTRTLKLTGCREGEFTCSDGQCIRGQTLIYQTREALCGLFCYVIGPQRFNKHCVGMVFASHLYKNKN